MRRVRPPVERADITHLLHTRSIIRGADFLRGGRKLSRASCGCQREAVPGRVSVCAWRGIATFGYVLRCDQGWIWALCSEPADLRWVNIPKILAKKRNLELCD